MIIGGLEIIIKKHKHVKVLLLLLTFWFLANAHAQDQGNGLLEALWKLQESLQNQIQRTSASSTRSSLSSSAGRDGNKITNSQDSRKRQPTNRRGLFEFSIQTHFSILPSVDENLKPQQSIEEKTSDSWVDQKTECTYFNRGKNSYWTFSWCPQSHVSQIHLESTRGLVDLKAPSRTELGFYEEDTIVDDWKDLIAFVDQKDDVEFYTDGDYCYPSEGEKAKSKIKRRTLVVYCSSDHLLSRNQSLVITEVSEPIMCQYILHVCVGKLRENHLDTNEKDLINGIIQKPETQKCEIPETNSNGHFDLPKVSDTNHLEFLEDVQRVIAAYTKTTGKDEMDMTFADKATTLHSALPPLPPSRRAANLDLIREMFMHAYDSYMYNAYPASEIKPLTCQPGIFHLVKLPALTLIDTLDTLAIMKNFTEFARGVERLRDLHLSTKTAHNDGNGQQETLAPGGLFSSNTNVSLFETNIRVLGGLLSAHQLAVAYLDNKVPIEDVRDSNGTVLIGKIPSELNVPNGISKDEGILNERPSNSVETKEEKYETLKTSTLTKEKSETLEKQKGMRSKNATQIGVESDRDFWIYDGFLLNLAHDIGKRLLPAFKTRTGIPYGTVNLISGIPNEESKVASLAGAGTLTLEFELLSRLTGDKSFGDAAKLASRALWMRRTKKNLLGKHINIDRGGWTEHLSGIGSNSDSFYEYLVKHYILFPEDEDFWPMFLSSYYGVHNESRLGEWYGDVDMNAGKSSAVRRVFESLMAFYPGMQVLLGEISPAAKTLNSFLMVREAVGLLPERFNYGNWKVEGGGGGLHPLRPELLESCYFLHKATEGLSSRYSRVDSGGVSGWLWAADYALQTISLHTKAKCGYSSVTGVSPETTGGIPIDSRRYSPKKVNEMPSFFLSETLKYLYLMFDADNLLHQDNDREWVFTTEAHPIHHVSFHNSDTNESQTTSYLRKRVYDYLLSRKNGKRKPYSRSHTPSKVKGNWTDKSSKYDYLQQIEEVENTMPVRRKSQLNAIKNGYELFHVDFIKPIYLPREEDEFSVSEQELSNIAHLSLSPRGMSSDSLAIIKGCPNIYSPSLAWVNALSGGAIDYTNIYVSTIYDETPTDKKYGVGSLSALHALALYGSGLYLGKASDDGRESCPAFPDNASRTVKHEKVGSKQIQRFDMGGNLGSFDVSISEEGNGFTIEQVKNGESIIVTVVQRDLLGNHNDGGENEDNDSPYVMVQSTLPGTQKSVKSARAKSSSSSSWFPGMNWKSVFTYSSQGIDGNSVTDDTDTTRSVIIGDGSGFTFSCEIQVMSRSIIDVPPFPKNKEVHPLEVETIIQKLPCAPALFGPTLISRLVKTNGITVEGELTLPDEGNEMGCADNQDPVIHSNIPEIRIVKRGICTFQSKSIRQRQSGARGVIVINSDPHDLFLMANGTELDNKKAPEEDLPVSTLISGNDGVELLKMIEASTPDSMVAKILLLPHNGIDKAEEGARTNKPLFPVLHASSEAIQIFSSGGWGVHAVDARSQKTTTGSTGEWQLFLLQHSISTENGSK